MSAIGIIAAFLVQSAALIVTASTWITKMDGRVTAIEISLVSRPAVLERFAVVEADSKSLRSEVTARLNRIEDKVDRLLFQMKPP